MAADVIEYRAWLAGPPEVRPNGDAPLPPVTDGGVIAALP